MQDFWPVFWHVSHNTPLSAHGRYFPCPATPLQSSGDMGSYDCQHKGEAGPLPGLGRLVWLNSHWYVPLQPGRRPIYMQVSVWMSLSYLCSLSTQRLHGRKWGCDPCVCSFCSLPLSTTGTVLGRLICLHRPFSSAGQIRVNSCFLKLVIFFFSS